MTETIEISISGSSLGSPITESSFGGEYLGWTGFPGWIEQSEELSVTHIRWPGGIIAEDRVGSEGYSYDITQPDIVDNWPLWNGEPRTGLTEILDYAVSNELSFSMIIPTGRYIELMSTDPAAAIANIQNDVEIFTERLFSGYWGELPDEITLEVGAEYYSTDAWANLIDDPQLVEYFGDVFAEIVSALSGAERDSGREVYEIAVQSGRFQSNDDIQDERNGQEADSSVFLGSFADRAVLEEIDAVIWHRYVYTFDQTSHHLSSDRASSETILSGHMAYWNTEVGHDLELVASWASPDIDSTGASETDPFFDYGPRSGLNVLQMFSYLAESGVDTATLYGIDSPWTGAVSYGGTTPDDYSIAYSGEVYRMMSESLVGLSVLEGFENNHIFVDELNTIVPEDHINIHGFSNGSTHTTVFLSAWDLKGQNVSANVAAPDNSVSNYISVTHLTPTGYEPDSGGMRVLSDFHFQDQTIRIDQIQDFDTIRLEFLNHFATELDAMTTLINIASGRSLTFLTMEEDQFDFSSSIDTGVIDGGHGDDHVVGSMGEDIILGGEGNDSIEGGFGNDVLIGESMNPDELQDWLSGLTDGYWIA